MLIVLIEVEFEKKLHNDITQSERYHFILFAWIDCVFVVVRIEAKFNIECVKKQKSSMNVPCYEHQRARHQNCPFLQMMVRQKSATKLSYFD